MRGWLIKDKFLVGPRKAQVQIGPQEFPPPSEEEVQKLVDKLEAATNEVDEIIGFDATLRARYGEDFVDYIQRLSDGLHYLLLQGRNPGPPPGFEAGAPDVGLKPGERGKPEGAPELPEGRVEDELFPTREPLGSPEPRVPAGASRMPLAQTITRLADSITDLETLTGDSVEDLAKRMASAGRDPEPVYQLNDAAEQARESVIAIAGALEEDTGE